MKGSNIISNKRVSDDTGIPYRLFRERRFTQEQKDVIIKKIEEGVEYLLSERYKLVFASEVAYNERANEV